MSSTRTIIRTYYAVGDTTDITHPAAVSGSMAADITGPVTVLDKVDQLCYQVQWTSANAVGTISVQGSVDNVTFHDITFDPELTQPNSNNGGYLINLALIPFTYVRFKYTRSSGTGSMTVTMSVKGV